MAITSSNQIGFFKIAEQDVQTAMIPVLDALRRDKRALQQMEHVRGDNPAYGIIHLKVDAAATKIFAAYNLQEKNADISSQNNISPKF